MECQICYDETDNLGCEKCSLKFCTKCVKEFYLTQTTPMPRCFKCSAAIPFYLLPEPSFYRSEYVKRVTKEIKENIEKRVSEAKNVYEIKKKIPKILFSKLGAEQYANLVAAARNRTFGDASSLPNIMALLTNTRTSEELTAYLTRLDQIFGSQEFSTLWTPTASTKVDFVCPWDGCAEGVSISKSSTCRNFHESCSKCRQPLRKPHSCSKEDLESVELVQKTCKACPLCFCQVEKTEGCDIMYCTKCGTGFDWTTLVIRKSNIHNPHAYDSPVVRTRFTEDERIELEARLESLDDEKADLVTSLVNMYLEVVESPHEGIQDVSVLERQIILELSDWKPSAGWKVERLYEQISLKVRDIWRRIYVEQKIQGRLLDTKAYIMKAASEELEITPQYLEEFGTFALESQPNV